MAAVLEYGFPPIEPAAMYSIFDSASKAYNNSHDQAQLPAHSLDGPCERPLNDASTLSDNGFNGITKAPLSESRAALPTTSTRRIGGDQYNDDSTYSEIDPNIKRRKRRKTSRLEDRQIFEPEHSETRGMHNVEPTSDKLNAAEQVVGQSVGKSTSQHSSNLVRIGPSVSNSEQAIRETLNGNQEQFNEPEQYNSQHPRKEGFVKSQRLTPKRKKTLSLHTNGKLVSSPTSELQLPDHLSESTVAPQHSVRNVKMKNGKFVQSLVLALRYGHDQESRNRIGTKINVLMSQRFVDQPSTDRPDDTKTHPFFLGKVKPKLHIVEEGSTHGNNTDTENDVGNQSKEPVPWKDIKFSSQRVVIVKSCESFPPIWPPSGLQHIGYDRVSGHRRNVERGVNSEGKFKTTLLKLDEAEDFLRNYWEDLKASMSTQASVVIPQRCYRSGRDVAAELTESCVTLTTHEAFVLPHKNLVVGSSAFDRGECAGPHMWPLQYAPATAAAVMQPSVSVLQKWLQSLAIHDVQNGLDTSGPNKKAKSLMRRKKRKPKDELDDFIVGSDEDLNDEKPTKTAILIYGPSGCGKTASVFAVAKELGFEVFEIHSGMRRTAKEILDKVGDMAHNHLVQKQSDYSRSSSVVPPEVDTKADLQFNTIRPSVTGLVRKSIKKTKDIDVVTPAKRKTEQKQSLILFEEVDNLFDDDKGFWNGVQSLIHSSRRPVVLTCNDLSSVPIDDLGLYDILHYTAVDREAATDYMMYLAAAEGHILDRKAVSTLYTSKGNDLRASITELSFWCQMTVGSKQGGLDWMGQSLANNPLVDKEGRKLRVFSQGTFHDALDLVPQIDTDGEAAILSHSESLDVSASAWCDFADFKDLMDTDNKDTILNKLSLLGNITDARSAIDLFDDPTASVLADATVGAYNSRSSLRSRDEVASRYNLLLCKEGFQEKDLLEALEPLRTEKPTFPPSLGRLAPALDVSSTSVATEIAPYVRCIVNFDQRMEQHRDELHGSQGKARNTRAARAAAEGGDKANTRSERWFPKRLNFAKVLHTAGRWPEWYSEGTGTQVDMSIETPPT